MAHLDAASPLYLYSRMVKKIRVASIFTSPILPLDTCHSHMMILSYPSQSPVSPALTYTQSLLRSCSEV
jgi:hypothetical protein